MSILERKTNTTVVIYHEIGHAVMARLFGRQVLYIRFTRNIENTYNGATDWGYPLTMLRWWDAKAPYSYERYLKQHYKDDELALIYAAGLAAERLWYRRHQLDEGLASFGLSITMENDELQLEQELLHPFLAMSNNNERPSRTKETVIETAIQLLGGAQCWHALTLVAQILQERLETEPDVIQIDDIEEIITGAFIEAVKSPL